MPTRLTAALLAAAVVFAPSLHAQAPYPNKPVHITVGYTTGGAADTSVRPLARVLEPLLGQPMIIEYRPGAAGADKPLREQLGANDCDADFLTPAQTTEKVSSDFAKWAKVVRDANIKPE